MFTLELPTKGDKATPLLRSLTAVLKDKPAMHKAIGAACVALTVEHIAKIAKNRHETARQLGAKQTGFYKNAVDAVRSYEDTLGSTLIIDHPGFARARRDVDIVPIHSKFLTIPINRISYGKRARELEADGKKLFVLNTKGGQKFLMFKSGNNRLVALYWLVAKVHQPMDETLLPTNAEYREQALVAVKYIIKEQVTKNLR